MDEKTTMILRGQSMIMEMFLTMMPPCLNEAWINDVNEFNQSVADMYDFKLKEEKE